MMWFIIGMGVLVAGGAATLYLVFHLTGEDEESTPFDPDSDSPAGSTDEHAGEQTHSAATDESHDAQAPPDAPGAPDGNTMPVGRYQAHASGR